MRSFDAVAVEVQVKELTLEALISQGLELRERKDNISWELGDLATTVTDQFGPKFLAEFSKGIGIEVTTIRRYRDVAKAYDRDTREKYKMLSWTHFRQVAAQENRLELLERAFNEQWSVEKLGVMSKGNGIDDGLPVPPKPELELCLSCRKWKLLNGELCPNDGSCEYLNN